LIHILTLRRNLISLAIFNAIFWWWLTLYIYSYLRQKVVHIVGMIKNYSLNRAFVFLPTSIKLRCEFLIHRSNAPRGIKPKFYLARHVSTRHNSTCSTCRAHAFWLCRACRTARLDTLDTSSSTARYVRQDKRDRRDSQLVCCVICIKL